MRFPNRRRFLALAGAGTAVASSAGVRRARAATKELYIGSYSDIQDVVKKVWVAPFEEKYGVKYVEWDEIFKQSDILTVQLALNAKTQGFIGAREIGLMKPTSLFINTARGKLVDQPALTKAVADGAIGGVAIDAYAVEPLPTDDPLLDLHDLPGERVTLTPHCAWQSPWTWVRDSQEIWFNVLRSLNGEPLKHLV